MISCYRMKSSYETKVGTKTYVIAEETTAAKEMESDIHRTY